MIAEACSPEALAAGGFCASDDGAQWTSVGPVTFANASDVLESTRTLPLPSEGIVDCVALHPVDSAGLAVLLAIRRRAAKEGRVVKFVNITASLHTLADLYGVEGVLGA